MANLEPVLRLALRTTRLPMVVRYTVTAALVLVALGVRWLLMGPAPGWAFIAFYPAVALAGLLFNSGSGLFAIAFSAVLGTYFFVAPPGDLVVSDRRDLVGLSVFLATAGFIALLTEGMHSAFARITAAQDSLEATNTKLAEAETQVSMLLRETIHRFRNDLQRLSATVALQISTSSDPAVKAALLEVQGRIAALAAIKARLDVALALDGAVTFVESRAFLSGLLEDWATAARVHPVSFRIEAERHLLPAARAILFGLVLNEWMTNAIKYAFPDDRPGSVDVTFRRENGEYHLVVEDNGIGHDPAAAPKGTGLGRRITHGLAAQMGGRLEIEQRPGGGSICALSVPVGDDLPLGGMTRSAGRSSDGDGSGGNKLRWQEAHSHGCRKQAPVRHGPDLPSSEPF